MFVLFCFFRERERERESGGLDVGNMWCIVFTCFIFNALAEAADVGWLIIWSSVFAVLNIGWLIVALDFGICPLQG